MNRPALNQAIRVLRTVNPDNFTMNYYINRCETVGCIAGHCAMDIWFVANGFRFIIAETGRLRPAYSGKEGRDAIMLFFQLTPEQTDYLFFSQEPTLHEAIKRIKQIMEHHQ